MRKAAATTTATIIVSLFLRAILGSETEEFFPDERDALIQLRDIVNSTSNLHANWTGPTCNAENESRWAGVGCSGWHVTHLVLEGIQLTSSLPLPASLFHNLTHLTKLSFRNNSVGGPLPGLTNLVSLEYISLSHNHFSGSIPSSYIDLPKLVGLQLEENALSGEIPPFDQESLVEFNVSSNQLRGPIPHTGVLRRFSESSYANNSGLCGDVPGFSPCPVAVPPPSPPRKNGLRRWSIAVIAAAAAAAAIVLLSCLCCYLRARGKADTDRDELPAGEVYVESRGGRRGGESEVETTVGSKERVMFELDDLLRSPAQVIGRGKVGTTYKAMLECGSAVAVKRVAEQVNDKHAQGQGWLLLASIKHRNLAETISFYHSKEEKLIVREYVEGGSLFSLLHENRGMGGRVVLSWTSRVSIIKDIAKGVEHLHLHRINHGNLKSSNVLIQFQQGGLTMVKLTDYGLVGVAPLHNLAVGRTPELVEAGNGKKRVTSKADIYCFGILVLEIVTGRATTDDDDDVDLSCWVKEAVSIDWSTDIVDLEIVGEKEGYEDMLRLTEMALQCTDHLPHRRPDIAQILATLQHIVPNPLD